MTLPVEDLPTQWEDMGDHNTMTSAEIAIDALEHCLLFFERDGIRPLRGYEYNDNDTDRIKNALLTLYRRDKQNGNGA